MDLIYNKQHTEAEETSEDFLKTILSNGHFSVLKFGLQGYHPPIYKHSLNRTPSQVWKSVLQSDRLQWVARTISREENINIDEVMKNATAILKEMAYTDHMTLTRTFGYTLTHLFNKIYQEGVYIGKKNIPALREALKHHPVVFMPSHRSYMDFLLLSLVCFHLNLPLPAIAAGMDFMNMKGVSTLLRASGAFFMRRSFGTDKLYWAIFTEYVHTIITNSDKPIEFFIEGTRSRTGKSLQPKLGLFNLVTEPYLKAQTYDVLIMPVSVSYGRVLEEQLYAYELLGIPKPKESTSGLFKAAGILQENYGSLHINFGELISVRNTCDKLQRSVHACYPRYMLRLSSAEQDHLHKLSYKVLFKQQENMVIHIWVIVCAFLCQQQHGIAIDELLEKVEWLSDILRSWKAYLFIPGGSISDVLRQVLYRHKYLITVNSHENKSDYVTVNNTYDQIISGKFKKFPATLRDDCAVRIMLGNYRNQIIHLLSRPALVAMSVQSKAKNLYLDNEINENDTFTFLRSIFSREFVFAPDAVDSDYAKGMDQLSQCGIHLDIFHINSIRTHKMVEFLYNCFKSYLFCYVMVSEYLSIHHHSSELKVLSESIQIWMANVITQCSDINSLLFEALSLNMISNCVLTLADINALTLQKSSGWIEVAIKRSEVYKVGCKLRSIVVDLYDDTSILDNMLMSNTMDYSKL